MGYQALINWERTEREFVQAVIEVNVVPQREKGFDAIAQRIVQYDEVYVGMLVDAVTEVRTINADDIDTTRAITAGNDASSKFISGIGKVDGRLIIQLNISEIMGLSGEE